MTRSNSQKRDRSETFQHCRRVCALARRTSLVLGLDEQMDSALGLAASLHHFWGPGCQQGTLANLFQEMPELSAARPADNQVIGLAEKMLLRMAGKRPNAADVHTDVLTWDAEKLGAEILEAANECDEAVEFAALEGTSAAVAIREFQEDSLTGSGARGARHALCRVISAQPFAPDSTRLPVLPIAAARLMRTTDKTSPSEIESIVSSDPVLAGRLLEVANSARRGPPQTITRLADAAARAGVPMARKVLLAASFGQIFASASLKALWMRSQRVAERASALAARAGLDPDEAYVAGLLHDVGRLVFERGTARSRVAVTEWLSSGLPLTYAEALTYSTDHAEAGAELLGSWGLPRIMVDAVKYHHQPERSPSTLPSLLFLADQWHAETFAEQGDAGLLQQIRHAYATNLTGLSASEPWHNDLPRLLAAAV